MLPNRPWKRSVICHCVYIENHTDLNYCTTGTVTEVVIIRSVNIELTGNIELPKPITTPISYVRL